MYPACARQVVGQGGSVERSPGGDRGGSTGGRRAAHGSCLVRPFCFRGFGIGTRTWARRRNHYKNNGYGISPDRFPLDGARGGQRELARLSGRGWGLLADSPSTGWDYSTDLLKVAKEIRGNSAACRVTPRALAKSIRGDPGGQDPEETRPLSFLDHGVGAGLGCPGASRSSSTRPLPWHVAENLPNRPHLGGSVDRRSAHPAVSGAWQGFCKVRDR